MAEAARVLAGRYATPFTGSAGQYHVAAQLAERHWAAAITPGNLARTDVLAQHHNGTEPIAIQVKTSTGGPIFQVGEKGLQPSPQQSREWFVLVLLTEPGTSPTFYVAPRNHVAAAAHVNHEEWVAHPKRDGGVRQVNSMRHAKRAWLEAYVGRWDLLHEDPEEVPWMHADAFWDLLEQHGLPEGFPVPPRGART